MVRCCELTQQLPIQVVVLGPLVQMCNLFFLPFLSWLLSLLASSKKMASSKHVIHHVGNDESTENLKMKSNHNLFRELKLSPARDPAIART